MFLAALSIAASAAPPSIDTEWGRFQGLMAGVTLMHAVQPIAVAAGDLDWKPKFYVSIGGAVLYGTTFGLSLPREPASLYIAIGGPIVGLTTISTLWILDLTGAIDLGVKPDSFQIVGGLLQAGALIVAIDLLNRDPTLDGPHASSARMARSIPVVAVAW